jgi:hypothetical protein
LLAYYDFPAEHWIHVRTSNVIESTFATLRHRTKRVKGVFSKDSALAMMLQLGLEAEKRWRRITAVERLGVPVLPHCAAVTADADARGPESTNEVSWLQTSRR